MMMTSATMPHLTRSHSHLINPEPHLDLGNRIVYHLSAAVGRVGSQARGALPVYNNVNGRAPMWNLEHLRRQAKLYLRWHRERYYPVTVQIRSVLARFGDLSDREVLDAVFELSDAQELVARKSGIGVGRR